MERKFNGSTVRPRNFHLRCDETEYALFIDALHIARKLRAVTNPDWELLDCEAIHRVIIPTFKKVVRAFLVGSAAERALASVYLEEFIRKDDYLSIRRTYDPRQTEFDFKEGSKYNG